MSTRQKADLKLLEQQAGMLGVFVDSGAFSKLPASVQRRWIGGVRRLYRGLLGVVPDDVLKTLLAGAAALVIGFSGCTDEPSTFADIGTTPDSALVEASVPDAGVDTLSVDAGQADGPTASIDKGITPDTGVVTPDTGVVTPDTGVVTPDTGVVTPDSGVATPDKGATADGSTTPADGGTPSKVAFKAPVDNPFGFTSVAYYAYGTYPALADMDGDGDLDLITGAYGVPGSVSASTPGYESAFYYQNTGTSKKATLAKPTLNVLGVTPATYYETTVASVDIDGDGDLDLFFFGGYYQELFFYENTGTAKAPKFGTRASNPFGLKVGATTYAEVAPAFVDIDGDGDLDLFTVEVPSTRANATLQFFRNTGTAKKPAFAAPAKLAFGLPEKITSGFNFADLDRDGDLDMIAIPTGATAFSYYKNSGTSKIPKFDKPVANPFAIKASAKSYASVFVFGDMDGDGDLDIVQGHGGGISFFENTEK